ncbi:MAG: SAM-dependent DNA methyltransferase [Chloroflexi bacterium]|nr:SAM-dependent DNA methyltransferase [Chloroflexota bacterium]
MAKQTSKKQKGIEETLWEAANKLRGSIEPGEYKHVVLSLIFLKYASDTFERQRRRLAAEGKEQYLDRVEFYTKDNVFYLEPECRWQYIMQNAKQTDIAAKIDTALHNIEKSNSSLRGALPDNYFSRLNLEISKLASLLDEINNNIDTLANESQDIVGRVYEYFLKQFSIAEKNMKGEFYTPKCIVNLIAEMIEPYKGIIYDPCCGTGGMFVQSVKFVEAHRGDKKDIAIYGQEQIATTYKLAKMNLAIRGISADLGNKPADSFAKDQHPDLKADYIMANPPFNLKAWRGEDELIDDPRWSGYDVPPASNANYGWILHMVSKLSENGVAGFLLANGALNDADTLNIRKKLIENDLIEAIITLPRDTFYSTDISVTLWVINKNKKERQINTPQRIRNLKDRSGKILFVDLRTWGSEYEKKYIQLTEDEITKVSTTYHSWQENHAYRDVPEFCYVAGLDLVKANDYSLTPSRYIEFVDRDSGIDFDKEMRRMQVEFSELLKVEQAARKELIQAFKELGYELE